MTSRMYDLRQKEVINTTDGARYGYVSDLEIDPEAGTVLTLVIPAPGKVLGVFGRDQEYRIPWSAIKKVGDDIILVDCETSAVLTSSEV